MKYFIYYLYSFWAATILILYFHSYTYYRSFKVSGKLDNFDCKWLPNLVGRRMWVL